MPASQASPTGGVASPLRGVETAISVHHEGLGLGHGLLGGHPIVRRGLVACSVHMVVLAAPEERRHRTEQTGAGGEGEGLCQPLGEGGRIRPGKYCRLVK